jgi:hypothetical protein
MKRLRYVYIFICLVLLSCALIGGISYVLDLQRFKNPDPFYSTYDEGFFGYVRFPLIKPYEMIKVPEAGGEVSGWVFELNDVNPDNDMFGYNDLWQVKDVSIEKNVIMAYTPYIKPHTVENGSRVLHWFVVVLDKNIKAGFETEEDFLAYIKKYGIDKPVWMDTQSAYDQFRKTGCLDWIPDCNQK